MLNRILAEWHKDYSWYERQTVNESKAEEEFTALLFFIVVQSTFYDTGRRKNKQVR